MYWIQETEDSVQFQAVVNTVMNFVVYEKAEKFFPNYQHLKGSICCSIELITTVYPVTIRRGTDKS
jgi:hypothetical protein